MVEINNLTFNQDYSCISVSTSEYHKIFNCEPFGEFYSSNHDVHKKSLSSTIGEESNSSKNGNQKQPTVDLKMLFSTSLTIIVPQSEGKLGNRTLKIFNMKQNLKICELTFSSNIMDIKLNRKRLVVFLEIGQIYIYDLSCVRLIKILEINPYLREDSHKPEIVGDLSADDRSFLVLPFSIINDQTDLSSNDVGGQSSASSLKQTDSFVPPTLDSLIQFTQKNKHSNLSKKENITIKDIQKEEDGWVLVYDTINLVPMLLYKAHDASIAKICISSNSTRIATASTKGTIIRVCHINLEFLDEMNKLQLSKITNLRRGRNLAKINTLNFSLEGRILGCGSESGTIHFFRIESDHTAVGNETDESESDDLSSRSSEDLNENLANLLISTPHAKEEEKSYFQSTLKKTSKLINNPYTKSIIKKLPYKNYLENLIWEPPRRSFAFIKLPESPQNTDSRNKVEIGFNNSLILIASYKTGTFYHYRLPDFSNPDKREECTLISQYPLM